MSVTPVISALQVLRENRDFRRLWLGEVLSMLGDWFNLVASASLISRLTGSGVALGGLFALRMFAPFLASPLGGLLADRFCRKRIMVVADLLRVPLVLGFLCVRDARDLWLLYTLTALQLAISGLFVPARSAVLADIVSAGELGAANALSSATYAVMQALGAALGGLSAGLLGLHATFALDALTFLASAWLCAGMAVSQRKQQDVDAPALGLMGQLGEACHYLRDDRETLLIALHKGANCLLVTGGLNVVLVQLAARHFAFGDSGALSSGLLFCATGIGTAFGALLARVGAKDAPSMLRLGLVVCYLASGLGLALAATLHGLLVVFLGVVVRGVGGGMLFVFSAQLLLQRVPRTLQGRIFGFEFGTRTLMSALGTLTASVFVERGVGFDSMLLWMAGLSLLPGLLWSVWLLRRRATSLQTPASVSFVRR